MTKNATVMTCLSKAVMAGLLIVTVLFGTGAADAASVSKRVELVAGKASTVSLGENVSDVLVANPAVVDVGILRSDRLFLVGKAVGDTNVLAFDGEGNQLADISVHVKVDQASLASAITEFFPAEEVTVRTVNNNIVLSGTASTPLAANRIRDLASRFVTGQGQTIVDLMGVKGEQQVMLQVKIMEARRSVLREYGIETDYQPGNIAARDGGVINAVGGVGLTALEPFANGSILFDDNNNFGPLRVSLQALERDGLVNVLAEPNLTAISGETAGFLAGGEFPVPTGVTDNGNTITIEFKQFGVSLNFTPTVLTEDNISLHLATEVSSLAEDQGVNLGVDVPGLTVRRAETTVEMASGGSIMIAGLIQSGTVDSFNGLPGISNVPILGELFKSKSFQREESELIIMVTPYLVKPFAAPRAEMASAAVPGVEVPSPLPQDLKPAYEDKKVAADRPVAPIETMSTRFQSGQKGEQRTQGVAVPITPQGRRHTPVQQEAPVPRKRAAIDTLPAAPVAPVAAIPVASAGGGGQGPALADDALPSAAPTKPSALSQHLARSLRATYGSKADGALHNSQAYGYLVD